MIRTIARKEFIETLRDGRFRASLAIALSLLLVSLVIGWKGWSDVRTQREIAQKTVRTQWLGQGRKNPHAAAHYGIYTFRPSPLLSFVDPGIHPYTGVAVWLEAHKQNDFQGRPARDATSVVRFGSLNAAFVMQVLIPLLIVLLAFGAFATERDSGTMRQVLSLGVPKKTWALGKMLGLVAALAVLLVPATVIGVAILTLSPDALPLAQSWPRMALMGLGYLLYFGIFVCTALAVSSYAKSSRSALVTLLGFWMFNCLLLPRVASDLARRMSPTPSAFAFSSAVEKDLRRGIDGHTPQESRRKQLEVEVLKKYQVKTLEELPVNFVGLALQSGEEYGYKVFDQHFGDLWNTVERQNAFNQKVSFVAPMLAARNWSMSLAGTDFTQHKQFAQASEEYRRLIIKTMNDDIISHPVNGRPHFGNGRLWAKVPEFRYQPSSLSAVVQSQLMSLGVLVVWLIASLGAALVGANQLQVEAGRKE